MIRPHSRRRLLPASPSFSTGTALITNLLTLNRGQRLSGDGRNKSVFEATNAFNMSALGVIRLSDGEPGAELYDVGISFGQNTDETIRANVVQYPPAIYAAAAPRFIVDRVKISSAWDGIDATGNIGGARIGFCRLGALNEDVRPGWRPGLRPHRHHSFLVLWLCRYPAYTIPFTKDGATVALHMGRVDGCNINRRASFHGKIVYDSVPSVISNSINALAMDGDNARLIVLGRDHVDQLHVLDQGRGDIALNRGVWAAGCSSPTYHAQEAGTTTKIVVTGGHMPDQWRLAQRLERRTKSMADVSCGCQLEINDCHLEHSRGGTHRVVHRAVRYRR